ncbi:orotidine-5'-phosphate decarboxylase [Candidatus Oleimmundimicrobium sp.]|uniref:orotidine-5'-phosphate decarboxylase n=1 Tax=Candidatus Oleimmundimicrobium sp. TaxID=3060597 RepID=UPI002723D0DD|nr:orotidine-5'-phosphate decarboxylase [Candidatus Oleimmundimicrobium sp.]MDO8885413.1 orotidine-5'-phosphate decarboxylase [Candidatus Oleimmundimicrobium sp.]
MKKNPLIVALDVSSQDKALKICHQLEDQVDLFKVGLELFLAEGPGVVKAIKETGANVFLDLKLHDIPNQVAGACREIVKMGVGMFTIHTQGGFNMMKWAAEATKEESLRLKISPPAILGVTILTSLDNNDLTDMGIKKKVNEQVVNLATMAMKAGLDGVVSSPNEILDLRQAIGKDKIIVVPGIRPKGEAAIDQKRVMSPSEAIAAGANYVVIGRPIIKDENPKIKAKKILNEIEGVKKGD